MCSLKRAIIFSLLFLIFIPLQNTIALSLPTSETTHYSGQQFRLVPGGFVKVEFAVYDNGGQELIDNGYELPWAEPGEFVYAYQVINDDAFDFSVDFFSIYGIGENAIASSEHIGSVPDDDNAITDGQEPAFEALSLDGLGEGGEAYYSSAFWQFDSGALILGEHSFFLLITSGQDYIEGVFDFQPPDGTVPVPSASAETNVVLNPEPGSLALLGLGSVLLFKKQRKNN